MLGRLPGWTSFSADFAGPSASQQLSPLQAPEAFSAFSCDLIPVKLQIPCVR